MSEQLIFNFPFKKSYLSQDFYVSENNIKAFNLIESWPNWSSRFINIFGPKGCGKTHLINILNTKIDSVILPANKVDSNALLKYKIKECLIIDDFNNQIDEKLFYTIANMGSQDNKYLIVTSRLPIVNLNFSLKDLNSRAKSFLLYNVEKPDDDMMFAIILKNLSDKQISLDKKLIDFIIKRIDRSYSKIFEFIYKIDELSLKKKKSIDLKIIKEVLEDC